MFWKGTNNDSPRLSLLTMGPIRECIDTYAAGVALKGRSVWSFVFFAKGGATEREGARVVLPNGAAAAANSILHLYWVVVCFPLGCCLSVSLAWLGWVMLGWLGLREVSGDVGTASCTIHQQSSRLPACLACLLCVPYRACRRV